MFHCPGFIHGELRFKNLGFLPSIHVLVLEKNIGPIFVLAEKEEDKHFLKNFP